MKVIRTAGGFQLNYEPLMRMYNISNGSKLSLWFDGYTADELLLLDDDDFIDECENNFDIN